MSNYRRNYVAGGTYFFTVVILNRNLDLLVKYIEILKIAFDREKTHTQFANIGYVVLPDHLHAIWRLPEGDKDYSNRWHRIKSSFSKELPKVETISTSRAVYGSGGFGSIQYKTMRI